MKYKMRGGKKVKRSIKLAILFVAVLVCSILFTGKVQAASATISESKTVTVGSQVTISASVTAGAWNLNLSGAGQSKPIVGQTTVAANGSSSASITFTASNTGTYVFKLTGDMTDFSQDNAETVSKSCTITVVQASSGNSSNDNNNNNSGNNNGNNSSSNNSSSNSSNGSSNNSNDNSNNDNIKTSSNIATLSNLGIKPNDFSGFSPSKMSYTVTVPNNVENIEVYAKKGQDKQTISGTGKKTLNEGENTFQVSVTAEDGKTKKTYTIVVTREKANEDQGNQTEDNVTDNEEQTEENLEDGQGEVGFGLSDLKIGTLTLKPEFKTDIYEYSAKLIGTQSGVDIETTATEANAKVEITGNDDLKDGENIITIMVTDGAGEKTVTYQITLQKSEVDEEAIAKQKEIEEAEKQKKILAIAIAVVLSVLIIVIIVISKRKKNMYAEQYTLPFANLNNDESQDEGQEEIKGNVKEEYLNQDMQDYFDDVPVKKKHGKGKRFK